MARLESMAKAGYYPTPLSIVERIAALIRPMAHSPRQAVRLLDPCCGTGAALRQFADVVDGETYGVEIALDRADDAQVVLDHSICGSAFAVRLAHGAFSCLWLNPPYDNDDADRTPNCSGRYRNSDKGGHSDWRRPQRRLTPI